MFRFYYNKEYKYTNRTIIDLNDDINYKEVDYVNVDSIDTINAHLIYELEVGEVLPTYVLDTETNRRYFVSGLTQLRSGKFQISLLRDIVSESDYWKDEEAYILAGKAEDFNKYKRWDLPFTNTKVSEQRLDINGKSSFFVFYTNTQSVEGNVISETDLKIESSSLPGITGYDFEVSNLAEIPGYEFINTGSVNNWTNTAATVNMRMDTGNGWFGASQLRRYSIRYNQSVSSNNGLNIGSAENVSENSIFLKTAVWKVRDNINNVRTDLRTAIINFTEDREDDYGTRISNTHINNLQPYVDKIIRNTTDNKVYRLKLTTSTINHNDIVPRSQTSLLRSAFNSLNIEELTNTNIENLNQRGEYWYTFQSTRTVYTYVLEELGVADGFNFNFIANQRKLPRSAVRCVNIVSDSNFTDDDITQALMLAQLNGANPDAQTGRIIDIQFLPFSIATTTNSNIKINNNPLVAQFLDFDDYEYNTSLPNLTNINKETDTVKIVSPSRASQFLFRPYLNDGIMEFSSKITIRPFNSTIYIRPSTKGLLLQNWDDKDCLIISEDFSLTQVNSDWTNYVYNNRNWQNAFERDIQGREFSREWERRIEGAQQEADNWTARNISAQKAQTYTGNIPLVSGIAGAVGTAWQDNQYMQAAQLDREYNESLYQEALNIARDQFSYQIDNIKSQPAVPTKITTIDSKFLDGVYLEFYSTNVSELQAINDFYKYNGNRIDAYGTFRNYYGWFLRGKIIKAINYTQPEIDELNKRLSLGVFTEVQYGN